MVAMPLFTVFAAMPLSCACMHRIDPVGMIILLGMMRAMIRAIQQLQIFNPVIASVMIDVMDMHTTGNAPMMEFPNGTMQPSSLALKVMAALVVSDAIKFLNGLADNLDSHIDP